MTSTSVPTLLPRKHVQRPLISRFAPAILALSLGWGATDLFATATEGQTKLNAQLEVFRQDFYVVDPVPDQKLPKATSTITAKQADLILALAAALEDPANAGIATADFIAAALLPGDGSVVDAKDAGKTRSDRDKTLPLLVEQAIKSRNLVGDDAAIAALVEAAFINAKTPVQKTAVGLSTAGQAAVLGQALKYASSLGAGQAIAEGARVKQAIVDQGTDANKFKYVATAILNANAGTGGNSASVASFLDSLYDTNTLQSLSGLTTLQKSIAIAKLVKKDNDAVGAVFAGAIFDATTDQQIQDATTNALAKANGLQAAATFITAAAADKFAGDLSTFATAVVTAAAITDNKVKAGVAGGVIKSADGAEVTEIYNALKPVKPTDEQTFASLAAVGNDDDKVAAITTLAAGNASIDKNKLGAAIVAAISLTNPDSADAVGDTLGALASITDKNKLAGDLAKAAKSSTAAGLVAAGVANNVADTSKGALAIAANKAASKYVSSISMEVAKLFGTSAERLTFASDLATANTGKSSDIAVGVSMADPIQSDQIVNKVIFAASGKIRSSAAKIVQAVSTAVDVEEVAEIVTQVATHFDLKATDPNKLKVSTANAIATAAAKAIQAKPGVKTSNRQDELGEVAASLVGQLITRWKADATLFKDAAALAKAISGVTSSVIKTLSKKQLVDVLTQQADLTAAANVAADVANTVKQAMTNLGLTSTEFDTVKNQLLKDIPKLGGAGYADYKLNGVLTPGQITIAMNDGFNGTNNAALRFEDGTQLAEASSTLLSTVRTGSILDPETDSRNF